jgi:hypothetical protein
MKEHVTSVLCPSSSLIALGLITSSPKPWIRGLGHGGFLRVLNIDGDTFTAIWREVSENQILGTEAYIQQGCLGPYLLDPVYGVYGVFWRA